VGVREEYASTDWQVMGCELRQHAFGGPAPSRPAGGAMAPPPTPYPLLGRGSKEGKKKERRGEKGGEKRREGRGKGAEAKGDIFHMALGDGRSHSVTHMAGN